MKRFVFFVLVGTVLILTGNTEIKSQDITLGSIYAKENVPYRRPVPLPHLREADIGFTKMIWRMVDLREKINHPLYFPAEPFGSRISLIDLLYKAVSDGELEVYETDEFKVVRDLEAIDSRLGGEMQLATVADLETGEETTVEIPGEVRTHEVRQYLLLEQWYFDKQHSTFKSRLIGFSPIRVYQRLGDDGVQEDEVRREFVFWVYYPAARDILARQEVFTGENDLSNLSFDDIFLQRRFSGYIYKESNLWDREIQEYALGRDALYEAQRIHNLIFDFEQDLWEY